MTKKRPAPDENPSTPEKRPKPTITPPRPSKEKAGPPSTGPKHSSSKRQPLGEHEARFILYGKGPKQPLSAVKQTINSEEMEYSNDRKAWANRAGFDLFDRIEMLQTVVEKNNAERERDRAEREKDRAKSQYYEKLMKETGIQLRRTVLDTWSKQSTQKPDRQARNNLAHGGAILLDYDVITHQTNKVTQEKWKKSFKQYYTVSLQMCKERFDGTFTDDTTVELLNQRANVVAMDKWMDDSYSGEDRDAMREARGQILGLCDGWISRWKQEPMLTPSTTLLEQLRSLDSQVSY